MRRPRRYPAAELLADLPRNLGEWLQRVSMAYGDRPAVEYWGDGEPCRWTFRDLVMRARGVASLLVECGMGPGDRLVLWADNSPEWLAAYLGIALLGAVVVPADPQMTPEELGGLWGHAEPRGLFASERLLASWTAPAGSPCWTLEHLELQEVREGAPDMGPDDLAAILYTSGTTGSPKGVMLTHRNLLADVQGCGRLLYVYPEEAMLALLPLYHAYALLCVLFALSAGMRVVIPASLRPDRIVAVMREARVTGFPAVPLVVDHLARAIRERIAEQPIWKRTLFGALHRLSCALRPYLGAGFSGWLLGSVARQLGSLRGMIVGGAALHADSVGFFYGLGITVLHGYGLTEAAPVVSFTTSPWRPGDGVGVPLPGTEVRIESPDAEGVGEIAVRGPHVMRGYYRDDEATTRVLQDGWLRTGDLGRLDSRGYLHVLGRSKDVIVLPSGKNVYPDEFEERYEASPLVAELSVLAGRDRDGAECPCGVIVPSAIALDQASGDEGRLRTLLQAELNRLSTGLADYKRLKHFTVRLEPLPRTASRKVRRHALNQEYEIELKSTP